LKRGAELRKRLHHVDAAAGASGVSASSSSRGRRSLIVRRPRAARSRGPLACGNHCLQPGRGLEPRALPEEKHVAVRRLTRPRLLRWAACSKESRS